jgi:hypothetical protein
MEGSLSKKYYIQIQKDIEVRIGSLQFHLLASKCSLDNPEE